MKKCVGYKILSLFLLFVLCIPFTETFAENEKVMVYRAQIQNGTGPKDGILSATIGMAQLNFHEGTITLSAYYDKETTKGKIFYTMPPDGNAFYFSYIFHPTTGKVEIALNDEVIGYETYPHLIQSDLPSGFEKLQNTQTSSTEAFRILSEERFEGREQSLSVTSSTTADVTIFCTNPLPVSELKKIYVWDNSNKEHTLIDYQKNGSEVKLFFKEKLNVGEVYYIRAEELTDIYGTKSTVDISFSPQENGALKIGQNLILTPLMQEILGFENISHWRTMENILEKGNFTEEDLAQSKLCITKEQYEKDSFGAKLSLEHKTEGEYAAYWTNHPYYSTLRTDDIDVTDWSCSNVFSLWVYSEEATGEKVTILLTSDEETTPWQDGYTYTFTLDFVGEKELIIPFEHFQAFNEPVGFENITAIGFYAKIWNHTPNPYSAIYLDKIEIVYDENYPLTAQTAIRYIDGNYKYTKFDETLLNHNYPEIVTEQTSFPIVYQPYEKTERALHGYYPQYIPGMPSFDAQGNMYIYTNMKIEFFHRSGKWEFIDLREVMHNYFVARGKHSWELWENEAYQDCVLRFDDAGGVYAISNTNIGTYLLYSPNNMVDWQVYSLPRYMARFERPDGNNTDIFSKPPKLLLNSYDSGESHSGELLIIEKNEDGTLNLDHRIIYTDNCFTPAVHSGDANMLVTRGDMVYIVYAKYSSLLSENEIIPAEHPANAMEYIKNNTTYYCRKGIPCFVKSYNIATGELSAPTFVGYGGSSQDNHNWPAISVDSQGRLHVIMNGHHSPIYYTKTVEPSDITTWSGPEAVGIANTYGTLQITNEDEIYICARNSQAGYRFNLSLYQKSEMGEWEHSFLIARSIPYYAVWRNRMALNPVTGDLFVYYSSQSESLQMFYDRYCSYLFTWPDLERSFLNTYFSGEKNLTPTGSLNIPNSTYRSYIMPYGDREKVLLTLKKNSQSWDFMLTEDLIKHPYIRSVEKKGNGVMVSLINNSVVYDDTVLYVAEYKDGKLQKVSKAEQSIAAKEDSVFVDNISADVKDIRIMLWEKDTLKPICPSY